MESPQTEQEEGGVRRRILEWEIQILLASSGGYFREIYQMYTQLPHGSIKDRIGEEILRGERRKEYLQEIANTLSTGGNTELISAKPSKKRIRIRKKPKEKTSGSATAPASTSKIDQSILHEIEKIAKENNLPEILDLISGKKGWREIIEEIFLQMKSFKEEVFPEVVHDSSEAKKTVICFNCEKKGHIVKYCPIKPRPSEKK